MSLPVTYVDPDLAVSARIEGLLQEALVDTPDRLQNPKPHSQHRNDRRASGSVRLDIRVSRGAGAGSTRLAAFDTALCAAGVGFYNIIQLSSVIPPDSLVREVSGEQQHQGAAGDVAYCVYAVAYASTRGEQAWAGVAWANHQDQSGAGLFVEHAASSEAVVRRDLHATLETMSHNRGNTYKMAGQVISSAICLNHPVCAVVVATYGTAGWSRVVDLQDLQA